MPDSTDETKSDTLPNPEMNPLRNPLLAANMGRWAEVYFTTPPEKRAEAVAALIRELESAPAAAAADIPAEPHLAHQAQAPAEVETSIPVSAPAGLQSFTLERGIVCPACGRENPEAQLFCGMCGSALVNAPVADEPAYLPESAPASFLGLPNPYDATFADRFKDDPIIPQDPSIYDRTIPSFAVEPEHVPYRYRMYVGAVLAIILAALIYVAWRGKRIFSGSEQSLSSTGMPATEPAPPVQSPVVVPAASEKPPQPSNSAATDRAGQGSVDQGSNGSSPAPQAGNAQPQTASPGANDRQASTASPQAVKNHPRAHVKPAAHLEPVATNPPRDAGEQEFATAQKFLGGSPGSARDTSEAAVYLWKAVSKGNGAATVALSDLYLHGDGVPKSCDQARLLLDLGAQKGAKGAAERLRNMQAFGCQ